MKHIVLVLAAVLGLGLVTPVSAAPATHDPAVVTFPAATMFNPLHTPYVITVHDPNPELGDFKAVVQVLSPTGGEIVTDVAHEGETTIAFPSDYDGRVDLQVYRCSPADFCTVLGDRSNLEVVSSLKVTMSHRVVLGEHSRLPLRFAPTLRDGDVVHLQWTVTGPDGEILTSGSADHVVGEPLPNVGVRKVSRARARLEVHAVADSVDWGQLEGTASRSTALDFVPPALSVSLPQARLFPARDHYLDRVALVLRTSAPDVHQVTVTASRAGSTPAVLYQSGRVPGRVRIDGVYRVGDHGHGRLEPGRHRLSVVVVDSAGNSTTRTVAMQVDDRRLVHRTSRTTLSAASTLVDQYVGSCSHLGPAAGRGWSGSLGLYSSRCKAKNGDVVLTVHGVRLPVSVDGYHGRIDLAVNGGAARGASGAYLVHTWRNYQNDLWIRRSQFDGRMGAHQTDVPTSWVVMDGDDGRGLVYWQLGLAAGSRYDVRSFTIVCTYGALAEPRRSRTASDANTIAEPSGAPGPGYTLPKTDAAELLEAYSPST